MTRKIPNLSDLYQLARQLERDKDASVKALRVRDHKIGLACEAKDDSARLLYWLREVCAGNTAAQSPRESWLTEPAAAYMARVLAVLLGFCGMMSLLLTSGQGLVNVFVFVFIFVFLQFAMSCFAAWTMVKTVRGNTPVVLPINPAKLMLSKIYPDLRYFREVQGVLRIAFLRYGQEIGALFTVGAMIGFLLVLAMSNFTFVWGSTFQVSAGLVTAVTDFLAWPWASLLPTATMDPQVIADSRYHPALTRLSHADIERMRGWWPFLFMSLACYALLPRVLLWVVSRFYFTRFIKASFTGYPRADLVLARMRAPIVETQGEVGSGSTPHNVRLFLLDWAQALGDHDVHRFEAFAAVPPGNVISAGIGSLAGDIEQAAKAAGAPIDQLLVAVKSWEPPLAELADFLAEFSRVGSCIVYPLAIPGRSITEDKMEDWRNFARTLPFPVVDVRALEDL